MALARSRVITRLMGSALLCLAFVAALLPVGERRLTAQEDTAEADATVRVIHASPGAPEVDVLVDGQTLLQGLAYGTASGYATITAEEHRVQVVPPGKPPMPPSSTRRSMRRRARPICWPSSGGSMRSAATSSRSI